MRHEHAYFEKHAFFVFIFIDFDLRGVEGFYKILLSIEKTKIYSNLAKIVKKSRFDLIRGFFCESSDVVYQGANAKIIKKCDISVFVSNNRHLMCE